jgi:hypothetical protein
MGRSEKELAHYTHVRDEHAMTISAHVKAVSDIQAPLLPLIRILCILLQLSGQKLGPQGYLITTHNIILHNATIQHRSLLSYYIIIPTQPLHYVDTTSHLATHFIANEHDNDNDDLSRYETRQTRIQIPIQIYTTLPATTLKIKVTLISTPPQSKALSDAPVSRSFLESSIS